MSVRITSVPHCVFVPTWYTCSLNSSFKGVAATLIIGTGIIQDIAQRHPPVLKVRKEGRDGGWGWRVGWPTPKASSSSWQASPSPFWCLDCDFFTLRSVLEEPELRGSCSGGFLVMKVLSLWRRSTMPTWPQAIHRWPMLPFFTTCIKTKPKSHPPHYNSHVVWCLSVIRRHGNNKGIAGLNSLIGHVQL